MTTIDTPEFDLALEQDASGEFHRSVQEFLARSLVDMSASSFSAGSLRSNSNRRRRSRRRSRRATDVIRFSAAQISSRSVQPITS
jgi:hypothetical protein